MIGSIQISGKTFSASCADPLSQQLDWLLSLFVRIEAERGHGFLKEDSRIQVGWSVLTIVLRNGRYLICEPDFAGDPLHGLNEDLTCSLNVLIEQNSFLNQLQIEGSPVSFQDKVVVAKDCLNGPRLFLERKTPSVGDSGWYIGPAGESSEDSRDYEAVFAYQFLRLRPALLKVLALPEGYLVVFDHDKIEAVLNDQNQELQL